MMRQNLKNVKKSKISNFFRIPETRSAELKLPSMRSALVLYKIVINALSYVKQEIIAFFRQGFSKWDVWTGIIF